MVAMLIGCFAGMLMALSGAFVIFKSAKRPGSNEGVRFWEWVRSKDSVSEVSDRREIFVSHSYVLRLLAIIVAVSIVMLFPLLLGDFGLLAAVVSGIILGVAIAIWGLSPKLLE
jgi:Mg/Co/Ni transporter MgtE